MLKKLSILLFIILLFTLSSCSLSFSTISTKEKTKSSDKITMKDGALLLGDYGDYVEYINESQDSLEDIYLSLKEKVKGETINDIFEENYEKGLLEFFNINNKVELVINISEDTLEEMNDDYLRGNTESYRECSIDIYYINLHFHYEGIGLRQKGNLSRGEITTDDNKVNIRHYKLSFEETFDDEYRDKKYNWKDSNALNYRKNRDFFGLDKLDLRWNRNEDNTYLKEYYSYLLYRNYGVLAQKSNPMNIKMNISGNMNNLGVYLVLESINNGFIKRNIVKDEEGGDLYKLTWGSGVGARFDSVDSNLFGVESLRKLGNGSFYASKYTYDLKTNKKTSNMMSIKGFISDLLNEHGNTIYDFMNRRSNYNMFITYLAISYLEGDPDDLRGNYNNTYVYFTFKTNKIIFIPVDSDRTFGNGRDSNPTGNFQTLVKPLDKKSGYSENTDKLINVCLFSSNSTTLKDDFIKEIKRLIDDDFYNLGNFISYYNIIKNHYESDLVLGDKIVGPYISFSLDGSTNIYGSESITMKTYADTKTDTFLNFYKNYF